MKPFFAILCAVTALASCDSGDIYPEDSGASGRTVAASFNLEGLDAFPKGGNYMVAFAAFASDGQFPLTLSVVSAPGADGTVSVELSDVPDGAQSVSLCLLDKSTKLVHRFYTYDLGVTDGQAVTIPAQTIALNGYGRVQQQLFSPKCIGCHGAGSGAPARGLNLTEGHSHAALVGVASKKNPAMMLASPGSPSSSFLLKALTEQGALATDHPEIVEQEDVALVRSWLTAGCNE